MDSFTHAPSKWYDDRATTSFAAVDNGLPRTACGREPYDGPTGRDVIRGGNNGYHFV